MWTVILLEFGLKHNSDKVSFGLKLFSKKKSNQVTMITKQKKFIPITPFESIVALVMSKNTSSRDKRANYLEHAGQK